MGDSLRKVKQRIKAFLLFHGLEEPVGLERWTLSAVDALTTCEIYPILRDVLDDYLEELRHVRVKLSVLEKKMAAHTASVHQERLAALRSVPGIGRIVACSLLTEFFRPERFERGEEVAAYLGLAPFVRHSGEKTPAAKIRPTGQTRLRSLLVEAAVVQKAITAIARKLSIILWRLALEKRAYRPA